MHAGGPCFKCEVWIHHSRMKVDEILEVIVGIRTLMVGNNRNPAQPAWGKRGIYQLSRAKLGSGLRGFKSTKKFSFSGNCAPPPLPFLGETGKGSFVVSLSMWWPDGPLQLQASKRKWELLFPQNWVLWALIGSVWVTWTCLPLYLWLGDACGLTRPEKHTYPWSQMYTQLYLMHGTENGWGVVLQEKLRCSKSFSVYQAAVPVLYQPL